MYLDSYYESSNEIYQAIFNNLSIITIILSYPFEISKGSIRFRLIIFHSW